MFSIKDFLTENKCTFGSRIDEAEMPYDPKSSGFTPQEKQVLKQLKAANGSKPKFRKDDKTYVSYTWDTKSDRGFSLSFSKDSRAGIYIVALWEMIDGEATGDLEDDYTSPNFRQAVTRAQSLVKRVK